MGHEPTPSTSGAVGFPAEALGSRWMSRPRAAQCVRGTDTEPPSQAEGASSRMLVRLPFDFLFSVFLYFVYFVACLYDSFQKLSALLDLAARFR